MTYQNEFGSAANRTNNFFRDADRHDLDIRDARAGARGVGGGREVAAAEGGPGTSAGGSRAGAPGGAAAMLTRACPAAAEAKGEGRAIATVTG